MADPIGTSASILALVIFVFEATVALSQALQDFQDYPEEVIQLIEELNDLQKILGFLRNVANQNVDDLVQLEAHLSRCGQACHAYLKLIDKFSPGSRRIGAKVTGWTKLQFAKKDTSKLKDLLMRTKTTISLVLGGLNLRRFAVTAAAIDDYQCIIMKVLAETQENLREINAQLDSLSKKHPHISDQEMQEWKNLQADKARCENNLQALSGVLASLQEVELEKFDIALSNPETDQIVRTTLQRPIGENLTVTDVQEFMEKIPKAIVTLEVHLSSIENKMRPLRQSGMEMRQELRDEKQAGEHRLTILGQLKDQATEKQLNVYRDVRAAKGAHQVIISTVGDLIKCQNVSAAAGAEQWMGSMSSEDFQSLCQNKATKRSNDVQLAPRSVLPIEQWVACCFAALFANFGFVMWITNRGNI